MRTPAPVVLAARARHEGSPGVRFGALGEAFRVLGAGEADYRPPSLMARNPTQRLVVHFGRSQVLVRSGRVRLGLSLDAVGYGGSLRAIGVVAPRREGNGVLYAHGGLNEWYVNGPRGLEQGFTVSRPAGARVGGVLTIAVTLLSNLHARVLGGGEEVTFGGAGGPVFSYGGLRATAATGRILPSRLTLHGRRLEIRVDTRGARYPVRIDPLLSPSGTLTLTSVPMPVSRLGEAVAVSADGGTAVVGGPADNAGVGAAWTFVREGAAWVEQAKLVPADAGGSRGFGTSVAISANGDVVLISDKFGPLRGWVYTRVGGVWRQEGAPLRPRDGRAEGERSSAVALSGDGRTAILTGAAGRRSAVGLVAWVFTLSGSGWRQVGSMLRSDHRSSSSLGDVAIDARGDTAVFSEANSGFEVPAWVFVRSGSRWRRQGRPLVVPGENGLGESVAISADGNTVLVGAPENPPAGVGYVFTRSRGKWTRRARLSPVPSGGKGYGGTVALSPDGSTAVIATQSYISGEAGSIAVFTRSSRGWTRSAELPGGSGLGFGSGLGVSAGADTILIGVPGEGEGAGRVLALARSGDSWTGQTSLVAGDETGRTEGGVADNVALSADGDTALVGSPSGRGMEAAWVFVRQGDAWVEQARLTAGSGEGFDQFGCDVALSADGSTALVGAPGENGGSNRPYTAGSAWVFTRSGSSWALQQELMPSDASPPENGFGCEAGRYGQSVALSADGDTALIGSENDHGGAGAAWVFSRSESGWGQQGPKLTASDGSAKAGFGSATALSADGSTALIGFGGSQSAQVFTRSGAAWSEQGPRLAPRTPAGLAISSAALSADGSTALIGGSGAALVFVRSGTSWSEQGPGLTPGTSAVETVGSYGQRVALSGNGNTALVSQVPENDCGKYMSELCGFPAALWAFARIGDTWIREGPALVGEDVSGTGLALSSTGDLALFAGAGDAAHTSFLTPLLPNAFNAGAVFFDKKGVIEQQVASSSAGTFTVVATVGARALRHLPAPRSAKCRSAPHKFNHQHPRTCPRERLVTYGSTAVSTAAGPGLLSLAITPRAIVRAAFAKHRDLELEAHITISFRPSSGPTPPNQTAIATVEANKNGEG